MSELAYVLFYTKVDFMSKEIIHVIFVTILISEYSLMALHLNNLMKVCI